METRDSYIFFDQDTAFHGEVSTDHLVLEGVITGDVLASKDVFLKQGSLVQGEISTKKYTIEEGSIHQGKLRMDMTTNDSMPKNGKPAEYAKNENGTASPEWNGMGSTNGSSTNGASVVNGSSGANGTSQKSSANHGQEYPKTNGHHENGKAGNENKTVFELINKVPESISEPTTNGQSTENGYSEAPPRERLW